jgi:hypothetical protein
MTEAGEFAMWLAIGAGQVAAWAALSPIIRALADRIARRGGGGALEARVVDLEQRALTTGETEAHFARIAELEERLDFAERLLAQQSGPRELERT